VCVCLVDGRLQAHVKTDVRGESVAAAVSVRRVHGDRHCMEARRGATCCDTQPHFSRLLRITISTWTTTTDRDTSATDVLIERERRKTQDDGGTHATAPKGPAVSDAGL
jgi:hypothetical protein